MGCGESACVHLYRRTDRQHLHWLVDAAARLAEKGTIPRDKAERLREAVEAVLEHLPKTAQDLEQEQMIKQLPKPPEPKPGSC
jgi:Ser/Thr protein kinase RdoA (MazF antagonist)